VVEQVLEREDVVGRLVHRRTILRVVRRIPETILIAPDSFKGTWRATEVADRIAEGLQSAGRPTDRCPVGDGGEGTLEVLLAPLGGELRAASVHDPLDRPIEACFGVADGPGGRTVAVVETAAASGLSLVAPRERDPIAASTYGSGQLIEAAVDAGASMVYVAVGGSASTDGGTGAIRAIRHGGGIRGVRLIVLCDVRTPFELAAKVFAPQKGADPQDVRRLTRRLGGVASRLERDPRGVPMSGAAGGLAGGLWAAFGAELLPGAPFVLDAVGFDRRMRGARAVITGEGKLDEQSLAGKAVSEVATRARQTGVPCHAIVGTRDLDAFGARVLDLQVIIEASTLAEIEAAGRRMGERL
jgi:glycerate kinase